MTYVFPPSKIAFPSPAGGVQIVQWQVNSLYPRKRQFNQTGSMPPSLFHPSLIPSSSIPPSLILCNPLSIPFSISHTLHRNIIIRPKFFHLPLHPTLIHSISPTLDPSSLNHFFPSSFHPSPHFPLLPPFAMSLHPSIYDTCTTPSLLQSFFFSLPGTSIPPFLSLSHFFPTSCFSYLPPFLHLSLSLIS